MTEDYSKLYQERFGKKLDSHLETSENLTVLELQIISKGDGERYSYLAHRSDTDVTPNEDLIYALAVALRDINDYWEDPLDIDHILEMLIYKLEVGDDL